MKRYIVLPDIHCPAYLRPFILAVLRFLFETSDKITGFILLGDFLDMKSISSYDIGSPCDTTLGKEYELGNLLLDKFDEALGKNKEKYFLFGNHEDRLRRFLSKLEASKLGSALQDIEFGLNLANRGYKVFTDYKHDYLQLGDLQLMHGSYCNIYASRKHADVFKSSVMFGHSHKVQVFSDGSYTGYNIGHMADIEHPYCSYVDRAATMGWVNAFAIIDIVDGITSPQIIVWKKDHFICDGKAYK